MTFMLIRLLTSDHSLSYGVIFILPVLQHGKVAFGHDLAQPAFVLFFFFLFDILSNTLAVESPAEGHHIQ